MTGFCFLASGQDKPKDRYQFAHAYLGLEADYLTPIKTETVFTPPDFGGARITIGGTHFWGKADFYVSFPLFSQTLSTDHDLNYSEGIITGARYLPLGLSMRGPRPFVGAQWVTPWFSYKGGPTLDKSRFALETGLTQVVKKVWTIELGAQYIFHQKQDYYISRTENASLFLPGYGFHIAVKRYFDFTAGLASEESQAYIGKLRERLKNSGAMSTYSIAAGISSTFGLSDVPYAGKYSWINQKMGFTINPDVAIGYYFHSLDAAIRVAYRPVTFYQESYGLKLNYKQHQVGWEAFKFLFDFKGFVPFAGLSVGATYYKFEAQDHETVLADTSVWKPSGGLVFGWDIRPTDVEWFILRTNLRYIFPSDLSIDGKKITASQLEFNFIQLVLYPERMSQYFKK